MKKKLSFGRALFLKSLQAFGLATIGFAFVYGEAEGMNSKLGQNTKFKNTLQSIHQNKKVKVGDFVNFGNPCKKDTLGEYKGFSLVSATTKLLKIWIDADVVTDNVMDNYLGLFRFAVSGYSKELTACFKEQLPGFKANGQDRTVGEAFVDNLVMISDLRGAHKISDDKLEQAIELGFSFQTRGVLEPNINGNFVNQARQIVREIKSKKNALPKRFPEQ